MHQHISACGDNCQIGAAIDIDKLIAARDTCIRRRFLGGYRWLPQDHQIRTDRILILDRY